MKKTVNILFTSIGNKVYLTEYFKRAYEKLDMEGKMVATGIDPLTPGIYTADAHHLVPRLSDPAFLPAILEICKKEEVHVLQPTSDDDVEFFAGCKEEFEKLGILVMAPSPDTAAVCRDKLKFFNRLTELGIPTVKSWTALNDEIVYPCIVKPMRGKAAERVVVVGSKDELMNMDLEGMIIQEKMEGTEYTIDYFADMHAQTLAVVPRIRMVVSEGESKVGRTHKEETLIALCKKLGAALGLVGQNTLQAFKTEKGIFFLENNMRFGGGSPLGMEAGLKSPEYILKMALKENLEPDFNFTDNLLMIRYSENLFMNYDQVARF